MTTRLRLVALNGQRLDEPAHPRQGRAAARPRRAQGAIRAAVLRTASAYLLAPLWALAWLLGLAMRAARGSVRLACRVLLVPLAVCTVLWGLRLGWLHAWTLAVAAAALLVLAVAASYDRALDTMRRLGDRLGR